MNLSDTFWILSKFILYYISERGGNFKNQIAKGLYGPLVFSDCLPVPTTKEII